MQTNILWWLLPDELLPLVVVGVALLVLVRVIRLSTAMGILFGIIVLPMLLAPIIEAVMSELPFWLVLLICAALAMSLLRGLVALLLGDRATGHLIGNLATDCVHGLGRLCLEVPKGTLVKPGKVVGGAPGLGEFRTVRRLPPSAIKKIVTLH